MVYFEDVFEISPLVGYNIILPAIWCPLLKSNIFKSEPDFSSNEWSPIRPNTQLSSINQSIEDWSVILWSTKLVFEYGDITSSGSGRPYPHLSW